MAPIQVKCFHFFNGKKSIAQQMQSGLSSWLTEVQQDEQQIEFVSSMQDAAKGFSSTGGPVTDVFVIVFYRLLPKK